MFQTEPNPRLRPFNSPPKKEKKRKIHTAHSDFVAFLKQENVNMVIFSTCFKTDQFSQALGKLKERERRRERQRETQTESKRNEKSGPHTIEGLPRIVCVFHSLRCGQAAASYVCTQYHRELWPGADGLSALQNTKLDLSHCESRESTTT